MKLCITKAVQDFFGIEEVKSLESVKDDLWHCTIDTDEFEKILIVRHIPSNYTIGINVTEDYENQELNTLVVEGIRTTMDYAGFKKEIIDDFAEDETSITYCKTTDREIISTTTKRKQLLFSNWDYFNHHVVQQPILNNTTNKNDLFDMAHDQFVEFLIKKYNRVVIKYELFEVDVMIYHKKEILVLRRLLIPSTYTLADLHDVIQKAFGWTNSHLHQFINKKDKKRYSPFTKELEDVTDTFVVPLKEAFKDLQVWRYVYDFGDDWVHEIVPRSIEESTEKHTPLCIGAVGENIPEDVGGLPGYEYFLSVMDNPDHKYYKSMIDWLEQINYHKFNQKLLNLSLTKGISIDYISPLYTEELEKEEE